MYFARQRRIVSADGQERDLDVVAFADLFETFEIGSVAAMKYRSAIGSNDEPAKTAMRVGQKTRTPMMCRRQRHAQRPELNRLPFVKFVDNIESEAMDQTPHANRNDDRLIGRDQAQSATIEMIEMRVRHENEIDRRQMMNVKTGLLETFDHAQPHRPDRIDQHVGVVRLN